MVARALEDTTSVFRKAADQPLRPVRFGSYEFEKNEPLGQPWVDRIWFDLEYGSLEISAEAADDTIAVMYLPPAGGTKPGIDVSDVEPWRSLVGKGFGWGWVMVNQQGYCDGVMLSFGGIYPQILLTVIASEIKISAITGLS